MKSFVYVSHHEIGVSIDCLVFCLSATFAVETLVKAKTAHIYMYFIVLDYSSKRGYYKKYWDK